MRMTWKVCILFCFFENDLTLIALRNARKEQTEQSQNDFADVEASAEDDIINHLTSVEQ